ncbi:MAG: cytochrome c biogenesis protein CcsA [Opitutales bacterium]|nr:cytochrome c biogenesis protein CcsA [Opitutales bacterium]MCH8540495.1 cytochrome c biogenesis protein [Opitutales bacterium]
MLGFFFEDRTLMALGALLYGIAFFFVLLFVRRDRSHPPSITYGIVVLGWLLQTAGMYLRGLEVGGCPLGNAFEILQFVVWSLVLLYLVVGSSFRVSLLGFFCSGLAALLGLFSLIPAFDQTRREWMEGVSVWIELHAALALFSYGVFAILALVSAMFLLRDYSLKKKTFHGVFHFLPSIKQLEEIKYRLLVTGLLILSVSLLLGGVNWSQGEGTLYTNKFISTLALWLCYLILMFLRWRQTLQPASQAWAYIGLFLIALITLGPVNASRGAFAPVPDDSDTSSLNETTPSQSGPISPELRTSH